MFLQVCVFCENNGSEEEVYKSHVLRDINGNISCPILRGYKCPICKASGDKAHTLRFCPEKKYYYSKSFDPKNKFTIKDFLVKSNTPSPVEK